MKLARYWSRDQGEAGGMRVTARGWSDESVDDARAKARDIARRVAERLMLNPGSRNQYGYGDRPLPEPVIREFSGGAVTRNAYGALVLNTDDLMFVDIDRQDRPDAIPSVANRHGLAVRVYKTAAGYRAIVANRKFQAGSPEAESLLREFGADPLYIRLCHAQVSFRARLTPKPWRCNFGQPPVQFPFETPQAQAQFERWHQQYQQRAASFATCKLMVGFGPDQMEPSFADLIGYHDHETKATSSLPLA